MAYQGGIGGTFKNLWAPDLSTRAGALSATESASTVFFIVAGLRMIFLFLTIGLGNIISYLSAGNIFIIISVAEIIVMIAAAILLRKGRGLIFAIIGAILYFLGLLASGNIFSWVVGVVLLGAMVGGVRGSLALSRGKGFDDDVLDTFG